MSLAVMENEAEQFIISRLERIYLRDKFPQLSSMIEELKKIDCKLAQKLDFEVNNRVSVMIDRAYLQGYKDAFEMVKVLTA